MDNGVTWTGTFTPTDDITDTTNVITVGTSLTDLAGNAPLAGGATSNYTIDTTEPVVSSVVMDDTALKVGETSTLTITFSEAVTGFDNTDITLENGTLTAVSSLDNGVTWTGTFTPTDDITDTTNVITVGTSLTDLAGNAPLAGGATSNYTIDTTEPVVSSVVMDDTALKVGETSTLTITFSEAVTGFDNTDITLENGTLTAVSSLDNGVTWTGTFTPTDDITDTTNVITVGTSLTDLAGNAPLAGGATSNYTIDTTEPVVSSVVMDDTALKVGETSTLTITFSEAVTGFDNTDITLENGLLTAVSSSDGGVTWTGTFTPTDDITDTTNVITVGTSLTDLAGNAPLAGGATSNYTIDTTEPVLTINSSQSTLSSGQTATITFSFNEVVSGFTDSDITVGTGGTLSSITTNDNQTFTAILTPDEGTDTVFDLSDATLLAPGNYSESKTIGDSNALTITLDAYSGSSASTLNVSNNGIGVGNSFVSDNESIVLDFSSDVTGFTFSANSLSSSETLSWTATLSDGTETSGTFAGTGNGNSDQSFTLEAGDLGKEMSSLTISNSGGGSFRISATQFEASQGEGVSGNITISVADNAFEDSAGNQGTGDSISIPRTSAPIAIDLDGDGIEYLGLDAGVTFADGSDEAIRTAWVAAGDALLVFDANNSGTVDASREYVFTEWAEAATSDMAALREVFDTNQDDVLDASDDNWDQFKVWQDANSDGVTDEGELKSLDEAGITSIALTYNETSEASSEAGGDVLVAGQSDVTWADGRVTQAEDTAFAIAAADDAPATESEPSDAANSAGLLLGTDDDANLAWALSDEGGAADDASMFALQSDEGEAISLADLLGDVAQDDLADYIRVESDGLNTVVSINPDGLGSDTAQQQSLTIEGVDLTTDTNGNALDTDSMNELLRNLYNGANDTGLM